MTEQKKGHIVGTGEYWSPATQKSYEESIAIQVTQGRMNLNELQAELDGGFVSYDFYERYWHILENTIEQRIHPSNTAIVDAHMEVAV